MGSNPTPSVYWIKQRTSRLKEISNLSIGSVAEVIGYKGSSSSYRTRLLSFGLTKGICFQVVRIAPLGDPIEIIVRDYRLTLRKDEADILIIREVPKDCGNCNFCK
ncbi:MAG: FeoA family protein [Bacillota bacterium]